MANEEELLTLTQVDRKIGELFYVKVDNEDDLQDVTKKVHTRRKSWIRTSSKEKNLLFLDEEHDEEKEAFMRLKLREISRMVEPEKKFLCLEYGPKKKPMFILLDFTNEPSECLKDWEDALGLMTGDAPPRRRIKTETSQSMRRPHQERRAHSTFQPTTQPIPEKQPQVESPQTPGDVFEPPTFSGTASGGDSPGAVSTGSDTGSDLSPFSSLKSTCFSEPQPEELKCSKEWLKQHKFKDHESKIFVTKTIPRSGLHIGDVICGINVNKEPDITMNTARLVECIRDTPDQTIKLDVQRGVEISVKEEEMGLSINIKGPKERRPDKVDVVMKACNADSKFAIAEINGKPVAVGTQTDKRLKEVLQQNYESHIHLIPTSLMRTLAEADEEPPNDADPDNAQDNVQEARPIDVGNIPPASGNANLYHNGETDC